MRERIDQQCLRNIASDDHKIYWYLKKVDDKHDGNYGGITDLN